VVAILWLRLADFRLDDIAVGLELVIGASQHDGVADCFMAFEKSITVCAEFCYAFGMDRMASCVAPILPTVSQPCMP
jgi:hypothetical protein